MKHGEVRFLSCMYVLSLALLALYAVRGLQRSVPVSGSLTEHQTIILDAGHGGADGGTVSATGIQEADVNLAVARQTDAVLGLLGQKTLLLRDSEADLSDDDAETISEKKVSDIRNRVQKINEAQPALLVSIHQNSFPERKYAGAQVFFGSCGNAKEIAEALQQNLILHVDPSNSRTAKAVSSSVYLMNHIEVPGILVECGFLSNPEEAARLQTEDYQKRLSVTIGVTVVTQQPEDAPVA